MANTISNIKMTNPLRGLVSKRRKRYQKDGYNLDLACKPEREAAIQQMNDYNWKGHTMKVTAAQPTPVPYAKRKYEELETDLDAKRRVNDLVGRMKTVMEVFERELNIKAFNPENHKGHFRQLTERTTKATYDF